jgi:hypothetical protein
VHGLGVYFSITLHNLALSKVSEIPKTLLTTLVPSLTLQSMTSLCHVTKHGDLKYGKWEAKNQVCDFQGCSGWLILHDTWSHLGYVRRSVYANFLICILFNTYEIDYWSLVLSFLLKEFFRKAAISQLTTKQNIPTWEYVINVCTKWIASHQVFNGSQEWRRIYYVCSKVQ